MDEQNHSISTPLLLFNFALIGIISILGFLVYITPAQERAHELAEEKRYDTSMFTNLSIKAKGFVVYDTQKQTVIYERAKDAPLPLASLTKVMMALTARELLPNGATVTIKPEFLKEEGDSGLLSNEKWKLRDLIDYALTVSSNDGARAIASVAGASNMQVPEYNLGREQFIKDMNVKAKEIGLTTFEFHNETGLDNSATVSGGYGSPLDVAKLFSYALNKYPDLFEATTKPTDVVYSESNKKHLAENTNQALKDIPNVLASKTGYTELAGGNLAVVFDAGVGRPIAVVVLGSTEKERFSDVTKLVNATLKYIEVNDK